MHVYASTLVQYSFVLCPALSCLGPTYPILAHRRAVLTKGENPRRPSLLEVSFPESFFGAPLAASGSILKTYPPGNKLNFSFSGSLFSPAPPGNKLNFSFSGSLFSPLPPLTMLIGRHFFFDPRVRPCCPNIVLRGRRGRSKLHERGGRRRVGPKLAFVFCWPQPCDYKCNATRRIQRIALMQARRAGYSPTRTTIRIYQSLA